jgi:hypothetical protein
LRISGLSWQKEKKVWLSGCVGIERASFVSWGSLRGAFNLFHVFWDKEKRDLSLEQETGKREKRSSRNHGEQKGTSQKSKAK